jgi:hypothetical protein
MPYTFHIDLVVVLVRADPLDPHDTLVEVRGYNQIRPKDDEHICTLRSSYRLAKTHHGMPSHLSWGHSTAVTLRATQPDHLAAKTSAFSKRSAIDRRFRQPAPDVLASPPIRYVRSDPNAPEEFERCGLIDRR